MTARDPDITQADQSAGSTPWIDRAGSLLAIACVFLALALASAFLLSRQLKVEDAKGPAGSFGIELDYGEAVTPRTGAQGEWSSASQRAQLQIGGSLPAYPALSGRIVDLAGLVEEETERRLAAELEAHEKSSSDQVVIVTLPSLQGEVLEDYANRLFRHWQLGQAGIDNGVLVLVARDERKIRIEVGYGLEGVLTDALARLIIETEMVPAFREGRFSEGISGGARLVLKTLSGDVAELEARKESHRNVQRSQGPDWPLILFWIIWGSLFFGPVAFSILARLYGKKTGKRTYRWLGIDIVYGGGSGGGRSGSRSSGGWSSGGGFSGGGGSSGGGGASGGW